MVTPQPITLSDLIHRLERLGPQDFTVPTVQGILSEATLDESCIDKFVAYRVDKYARHSIYRNALFDVMMICWKPGQVTPVHSHNGQCGWVRVIRGRVQERRFQYRGCNSPTNFVGGNIDCVAGGGIIRLDETMSHDLCVGPAIATIDRTHSIHQLGNIWQGAGEEEPAVTLHVYSLPHDSCVAYNLDGQTCGRVDLVFDTTPQQRGLQLADY